MLDDRVVFSVNVLLHALKPFLGLRPTMRTARPTTWSALSFEEFFAKSLDVIFSRFCLLHDCRPTDPFIARESREVVPLFQKLRIRREYLLEIGRDGMHNTGGD